MIQNIDIETNETLLKVLLDEHRETMTCAAAINGHDLSLSYHHNGEYVGGLTGNVFYERLNISLLAVHQDFRGKGIGSELIKAAIEFAKENKCSSITVSTLDYQGPHFYEKLGFKEYAKLENVPAHGMHTHFFIMYLS